MHILNMKCDDLSLSLSHQLFLALAPLIILYVFPSQRQIQTWPQMQWATCGGWERSCDVLIKCLLQTHHQGTACHIWNRIFHNIQTPQPISTSLHTIKQIYSFIIHSCMLLPLGLIIIYFLQSYQYVVTCFLPVLYQFFPCCGVFPFSFFLGTQSYRLQCYIHLMHTHIQLGPYSSRVLHQSGYRYVALPPVLMHMHMLLAAGGILMSTCMPKP